MTLAPRQQPREPIVLLAGDLVFGRFSRPIRTLLGSCVAIALWHPRLRLAGMCHFAVARRRLNESGALNARYGNECIELFRRAAEEKGTRLTDYEARIYGGGNMLEHARTPRDIELEDIQTSPVGDANVAEAFSLLMAEGLHILEADVGEQGYRKIEFDPRTGEIQVEFSPVQRG